MISVLPILLIGLATFLVGTSAPADDRLPPVNIVFDIDWTLTAEITSLDEIADYAGDPRLLEVEGKYYRLSNGVAEAMERLLDFNRRLGYEYVKISFFSGGARTRNEKLLKKILLDPRKGKSAFDIAEKILSFENLRDHYPELPADSGEVRFADRYEKNLADHFGSLERVIAIDDTKAFFRADHAKSLLWLGETFFHFPTYPDALLARTTNPTRRYLPPDFPSWLADENRIPIAALEIEYALNSELSVRGAGSRSRNFPFRDRLRKIHEKFSKMELFARLKSLYPPPIWNYCPALLLGSKKTKP